LKAGLLCTRVIQTSAAAQPRLLVDRDALEVLRSRGITHAVPQYLATTTCSLFGVKRPGTLVSNKGISFTTASVTCTGFVVLECAREQAATIYRKCLLEAKRGGFASRCLCATPTPDLSLGVHR
jgi:hypothetical protein